MATPLTVWPVDGVKVGMAMTPWESCLKPNIVSQTPLTMQRDLAHYIGDKGGSEEEDDVGFACLVKEKI
jgi:hypothetical protein